MNKKYTPLIIFVLVIGTFVSVQIVSILYHYFISFKYSPLFLIIYFILLFMSVGIYLKYKNKRTEILMQIIGLPFTLLYLYATIVLPILLILLGMYLYILVASALPFALYILNKIYGFANLESQTVVYIMLTSTSIIAILADNIIREIIYWIPPFHVKTSNKMKKYKIKELGDYLFTESNIRFTIYLSYFLYYGIYNVLSFQNSIALKEFPYSNSILQSFLTFLAYDSLITITNNSKFSSQELLRRLISSMVSLGSLKNEVEPAGLKNENQINPSSD